MEEQKYGILLNDDLKLQRKYFEEMCHLIGIKVLYRSPKPNKTYTTWGEIDSNYYAPISVFGIFEENPDIRTMRKKGWVAELNEQASFLYVSYDTPNIQRGGLFIIPSGIDKSDGRLFRVVDMQADFIYPSSLACEIVPEYENTFSKEELTHEHNDFSVLIDTEDSLNDPQRRR